MEAVAAAPVPVEQPVPPVQISSLPASTIQNEVSAQPAELKRKRTPSDPPPAPQKTPKTSTAANTTAATTSSHLAINYLARQYEHDLPLLSTEDSLPSILNLVSDYQGVLDRHESMACNLGARPLGLILIKRFERLFDGPPRTLKNHGKEGNTVTWLDVVEFARSKPEQFVLGQMSEGMRVCQIHTKQCRVQISEDDFMLISSGMPQKLIPPQPIVEDEEKELGTLEILEKNLSGISHLADQVAARTRQLKHRINGRKQAILERRQNEPGAVIRGTSPSVLNGTGAAVPVQSPYTNDTNRRSVEYSKTGASASTKSELLGKFVTQSEKERREAERYNALNGNGNGNGNEQRRFSAVNAPQVARTTSSGSVVQQQHPVNTNQYRDIHPRESPYAGTSNGYATVSPNTRDFNSLTSKFRPAVQSTSTYGDTHSHLSFSVTPATPGSGAGMLKEVRSIENDGPYRAEMVSRMEGLKKGDRVLPPCDRCRRLHMDCIKNLTACAGCTKKHAKCSWRDVRESELWGPGEGKVAIPQERGNGMDIDMREQREPIEIDMREREREREPSVGFRPERPDHASVQLLQALGGAEHHHDGGHAHHSSSSNGFSRDPRALAMEGLSAAEHQRHSHSHSNQHSPPEFEYQSPSAHAPVPVPPGYPSRPPSSGPLPSHAPREASPVPHHYAAYAEPLPSREVAGGLER